MDILIGSITGVLLFIIYQLYNIHKVHVKTTIMNIGKSARNNRKVRKNK